jgi:hypothetical protein
MKWACSRSRSDSVFENRKEAVMLADADLIPLRVTAQLRHGITILRRPGLHRRHLFKGSPFSVYLLCFACMRTCEP